VQVTKVLSITFLIEENNEIKRIYGIELHNLHIPPPACSDESGQAGFCRKLSFCSAPAEQKES
jgi:hypothetical protein